MLDFLTVQTTSTNPTFISVLYAVLLSFVLSTLIAFTYEKTFRGLSYSRNYIQALILSSIVAATIMQAIGDNLARGLGMIGAMAIIRFRTNFKDARDIIFMFAALGSGIAAGVYGFVIAMVGAVGFCAVAFVLYLSPFGKDRFFDGLLRFTIDNSPEQTKLLEAVLSNNCRNFALITLRDVSLENRFDYAYHVKLKKSRQHTDLLGDLKKLSSIKNLNLSMQEATVEL
jgi:uncharacterized membrane protein YhiD involved in acid resistance